MPNTSPRCTFSWAAVRDKPNLPRYSRASVVFGWKALAKGMCHQDSAESLTALDQDPVLASTPETLCASTCLRCPLPTAER